MFAILSYEVLITQDGIICLNTHTADVNSRFDGFLEAAIAAGTSGCWSDQLTFKVERSVP